MLLRADRDVRELGNDEKQRFCDRAASLIERLSSETAIIASANPVTSRCAGKDRHLAYVSLGSSAKRQLPSSPRPGGSTLWRPLTTSSHHTMSASASSTCPPSQLLLTCAAAVPVLRKPPAPMMLHCDSTKNGQLSPSVDHYGLANFCCERR